MGDKVLVVEDEPTLLETLEYNLTRQGYEVYTATDGLKALEMARRERPDAIVLDIMLPGLDGLEVCRILRREMSLPILMLTARPDEMDKVVGLEVGADDYLTKPFSVRELLARVKALLRRVRLIREGVSAENGTVSTERLFSETIWPTWLPKSANMARSFLYRERDTIRAYLLSHHYRTPWEYDEAELKEAAARVERYAAASHADAITGGGPLDGMLYRNASSPP